MHINGLLQPRQCVVCQDPPACACSSNEVCYQTVATCTACAMNVCKALPSSGGGGGGSQAPVIGGVVGVILAVAIIAAGILWYRRRLRLKAKADEPVQIKDIPAAAEDVLSRPDPSEKPPSVMSNPSGQVTAAPGQHDASMRVYALEDTIDLDPEAARAGVGRRQSAHSNPFEDARSYMTTSTSTHGTNIIPIELVPAGSNSGATHSPTSHTDQNRSSYSSVPSRPPRSPELTLNDGPTPSYFPEGQNAGVARSQISGISRNSFNSYASYGSDFLNESPTIVTARQGVRQVLGVGKAELVRTASPQSTAPSTPTNATRPAIRSPLSNTSFAPSDSLREGDDEDSVLHDSSMRSQFDPFSDSASPSSQTFAGPTVYPPTPNTGASEWTVTQQQQRDSAAVEAARAASGYIDTDGKDMGMLTGVSTPGNVREPGHFEAQQESAMLQSNAAPPQAKNRASMATNASGISNADTILESFPFVPPSPISALPSRTPIPPVPKIPVIESTPTSSPSTAKGLAPAPTSPLDSNVLTVPNTAGGLSTGASSNAASGLSPFTFDIPPTTPEDAATPTTAAKSRRTPGRPPVSNATSLLAPTSATESTYSEGGQSSTTLRKRSSLDTLALLSDLSSYPLGFDSKKK